mgnify:FL=1
MISFSHKFFTSTELRGNTVSIHETLELFPLFHFWLKSSLKRFSSAIFSSKDSYGVTHCIHAHLLRLRWGRNRLELLGEGSNVPDVGLLSHGLVLWNGGDWRGEGIIC